MGEADLKAGETFGQYELLIPIAQRGLSQLWAARLLGTRGFRKIFALKTFPSALLEGTGIEETFLRQAALSAHIRHPNVVQTLELGEHAGTFYVVMDWVDGEPLHVVLGKAAQHGGLPLPMAVNLVAQACRGLHAAHELRDQAGDLVGLVHRDISPRNLLLTTSGATKLTGFGGGHVTSRSALLQATGEIKGNIAYLSPEQIGGGAIDRRSDVFSVGVLLYMLTTGRHPFLGEHPGQTIRNLCSDKPALPPHGVVPNYPPALEAVLLRALSKDPEQRWDSAAQMLNGLEGAMPECLTNRFELELSAFVTQFVGAEIEERRRSIRVAEELANTIAEGPASNRISSHGSLRGVSLEPVAAEHGAEPALIDKPPATLTNAPDRSAANRKRFVRGAAMLVMAASFATLLSRFWLFDRNTRLTTNAALPAPIAAPAPAPTGAAARPSAPAMARAAPEPAVAAAPAPLGIRDLPLQRSSPRVSAPAVRGSPLPSSALPSSVVPSTSVAPRVDAWDPATFGGRH